MQTHKLQSTKFTPIRYIGRRSKAKAIHH